MKKHIVVAEDEDISRKAIGRVLTKAGYDVSVAEDGAVAYSMIKELTNEGVFIDLLLTDIQMPNVTGMQLLDKLREDNITLSVAGISSFGDKDTLLEMMRRGCSEFIDKPFTPDELIEGVERILALSEQVNNARRESVEALKREKAELGSELNNYVEQFDKLRSQVDKAVTAYNDLIEVKDSSEYNVDIALKMCAYEDLGGDYVGINNTENGCEVLLADVAGHDMGASYHTILVKSHFSDMQNQPPSEFLTDLNDKLLRSGNNERMVTAAYLNFDLKTKKCLLGSAAHTPVYYIPVGTDEIKKVPAFGDLLGLHEEVEYDVAEVALSPGDRFVIYTDGVLDAFHIDGETGEKHKLGEEKFEKMLKKYSSRPLTNMVDQVWDDILEFARHKLKDDVMLLGIEIPE